MRVLVINSGSSSLKFALSDVLETVVAGAVTAIGGHAGLVLRPAGATPRPIERRAIADHQDAVQWMFERLKEWESPPIAAVGHRVVHGGERFTDSVRITVQILADIEALSELAPLHNPPSVRSIRAVQHALGDVPMVAVFDTAFHRTLPPRAARYAIPSDVADRHRIRRYGFHGIAHASMAEAYAAMTGRPLAGTRLITLQLGNGCSMTAVADGHSVETSMGFTPLEGLMMGTRSGDVDPSIVAYLARKEGLAVERVEDLLNQRSGLLGVSGISNDMRRVMDAAAGGSHNAAFAVELFCYRIRKYLGANFAVLGGADAVIFGGGIGEQAPAIRARICDGMAWCGLTVDPARNSAARPEAGRLVAISPDGATPAAYVASVDEERLIAQETMRVLGN